VQRRKGPLAELQPRQSLAEEVAATLRRDIVSGSLRPGERLIELDLVKVLGVSRGPIREGMRLLLAEGLLTQGPDRGVIVPRITESRARDVYGLRKAIETRAIHLLGLSDPKARLDVLQEGQERLENFWARGDYARVADEDINFHKAICHLSGNERLVRVFEGFVTTIRLFFGFDESAYGSLQEIVAEHRAVLRSLETGDFTGASELLRSHIEHAEAVVTDFLRNRGP
jgi:DNA-binding GntR family transcriptional regulator